MFEFSVMKTEIVTCIVNCCHRWLIINENKFCPSVNKGTQGGRSSNCSKEIRKMSVLPRPHQQFKEHCYLPISTEFISLHSIIWSQAITASLHTQIVLSCSFISVLHFVRGMHHRVHNSASILASQLSTHRCSLPMSYHYYHHYYYHYWHCFYLWTVGIFLAHF